MKTFSTTAGAILLGTLLAVQASSANAQARRARPAVLPPYEVMTIVRSIGLDPANRPVLRGPVYVLRAFDYDDVLVRVTVNARTGRILSLIEPSPETHFSARGYGMYARPPATVGFGGLYRAAPHDFGGAAAPPRAVKRTPVPRANPTTTASTQAGAKDSTRPASAAVKQATDKTPDGGITAPATWIPVPVAPLD